MISVWPQAYRRGLSTASLSTSSFIGCFQGFVVVPGFKKLLERRFVPGRGLCQISCGAAGLLHVHGVCPDSAFLGFPPAIIKKLFHFLQLVEPALPMHRVALAEEAWQVLV